MGTIIPVFIPHAGCPHQCVFCNQKTISGQQENGIEAARKQIEKYKAWTQNSPDNEIAFYGGSFTALPITFQEQLLQLGKEYLQSGLVGSLRLSTRPDYINEEELTLLAKYQVQTVELGAQSLEDRVLELTERGHTAADVVNAVTLLKKYKFKVGLQLMQGLPGQEEAGFSDTVEQVLALKPALVRLYPVLVIKQTPLAASFAKGTYEPLSLDDAVRWCAMAYERFTTAGIQVVRMGLQPDEELCTPGNILAGPFHPAFGELVKSYIYKIKIQNVIAQLPQGDYTIVINVPPPLTSIVRGQHNSNVKTWESGGRVQIKFREGKRFEVQINDRKTI